ncbi:sodium-coupled monocarboxylate transporter 1-like [Argopecten irradians]|uniref:sodium-coupled monocarboxylate transporter 1-like n=1 Tax=Argopecten irradians TaxID=31199 RepID=UPI003716F0CE
MAILPVALSMMVSFESGIMMLSIPAEVYMYGMQWYISIIAMFVSNILVMHLIIPTQRQLNITSLTQYFELRYSSHTLRLFASCIRLLAVGTMEAGGFTQTWDIIIDKGRFNMLNFDPDPTLRQSFWSLTVNGMTTGLEILFSQQSFQRIKATRTVSTSKKMFILAMILSLTISGLAVLEGGVMFAYYHVKGCDPLEVKQVANQNQGALIGGLACCCFIGWISIGKLVSSGVRVNVKLPPASIEYCPFVNTSWSDGVAYTAVNISSIPTYMPLTEPQGLDILYSLSYKWLLPLGIILVFIIGSLASRLKAAKPIDSSLYIPVCNYLDRFLCWPIRTKLRRGVKHFDPIDKTIGEKLSEDEVAANEKITTHEITTTPI